MDLPSWGASLFTQPLVELSDRGFAGVHSPIEEVDAEKRGVNSVFLEDAEAYYDKYQGFEYWRGLIEATLRQIDTEDISLVVEYGCGFGNASLPMLDLFPRARLLATDISPNLLGILGRLLRSRGLTDRCLPVAMDALKPYVVEGAADLVFGAAILHHLTRPEDFIASALRVVRPGGFAFFFEPLEGGYAILLQIIDEVAREAERRGEWNHPIYCLKLLGDGFRPQIFRGGPDWAQRDDKWAFPRSKLDAMARAAGADATVIPLHDNIDPFRRQIVYMLETYMSVPRADVPDWIWEIVRRYDRECFSPEMLTDLALEGCVIFRRR